MYHLSLLIFFSLFFSISSYSQNRIIFSNARDKPWDPSFETYQEFKDSLCKKFPSISESNYGLKNETLTMKLNGKLSYDILFNENYYYNDDYEKCSSKLDESLHKYFSEYIIAYKKRFEENILSKTSYDWLSSTYNHVKDIYETSSIEILNLLHGKFVSYKNCDESSYKNSNFFDKLLKKHISCKYKKAITSMHLLGQTIQFSNIAQALTTNLQGVLTLLYKIEMEEMADYFIAYCLFIYEEIYLNTLEYYKKYSNEISNDYKSLLDLIDSNELNLQAINEYSFKVNEYNKFEEAFNNFSINLHLSLYGSVCHLHEIDVCGVLVANYFFTTDLIKFNRFNIKHDIITKLNENNYRNILENNNYFHYKNRSPINYNQIDSNIILHYINMYNTYFQDRYFNSYRSIITVTPLPLSDEVNLTNRKKVVQNLISLRDLFIERNITLSDHFNKLGLSGTFYYAHQGFNDIEIQIAYCNLFKTIFPNSYYLSPHLQLFQSAETLNTQNTKEDFDKLLSSSTFINHLKNDPLRQYIFPSHEVQKLSKFEDRLSEENLSKLRNYKLFDEKVRVIRFGVISRNFFNQSVGRILYEILNLMKNTEGTIQDIKFVIDLKVFFMDWTSTSTLQTRNYNVTVNNQTYEYSAEYYNITDKYIDQLSNLYRNTFNYNYIDIPISTPIEEFREILSSYELDLLIFGDVGMDMSTYPHAHGKYAFLQAIYWGHPVTTNIEAFDYYLTIDDEVPHAIEFYTEQSIRMNYINTIKPEFFQSENNYYELPEEYSFLKDSKYLVILGRQFKFHDSYLETIVDLLYNIEQYVSLNSDFNNNYYVGIFTEPSIVQNKLTISRIYNIINKRSYTASIKDRLRKRIILFNFAYYTPILGNARGVIDTYTYGGCITAHDSMYNYVPIITLPAEQVRGRYALSMYRQMEMMDLVAKDLNELRILSLKMIIDDNFAHEMKEKLKRNLPLLNQNKKSANEWLMTFIKLLTSL